MSKIRSSVSSSRRMTMRKNSAWMSLLVIVVVLLCGGSLLPTSEAKTCQILERGKELKTLVQTSHVLVSLQASRELDDDDGNDDNDDVDETDPKKGFDEDYQSLCQRLEETPEGRVEDFAIAVVTDSNLKRKVLDEAALAPHTAMERFLAAYGLSFLLGAPKSKAPAYPEYILYPKGAYENRSASESVGLRYDPDLSKGVEDISAFVATNLQRKKLGNFVYSLGTYDFMASELMREGGIHAVGWRGFCWVEIVGRMTQSLLHPPTEWLSKKTEESTSFEEELTNVYLKTARKIREKGPEYAHQQVDRLESMLKNEDNNIQPMQREEMSQRLYIIQKFAKPMEFSDEDWWSHAGRLSMHFLSLVGMVILIPLFLLTSPVDDEEEEEEEEFEEEPETFETEHLVKEEEEEQVDNVASEEQEVEEPESTVVIEETPDTASLSKKEKRALAIQRAKESMQSDKARVEQVKQERSQTGPSPKKTTVWTEAELSRKTVVDLKELLRSNGLRVSGNKAELVERLAGAEK